MMAPVIDQPSMTAKEAAAINAAAVTRNYSVTPRLKYQTVSAVSGPLIVLENVKVMFPSSRC